MAPYCPKASFLYRDSYQLPYSTSEFKKTNAEFTLMSLLAICLIVDICERDWILKFINLRFCRWGLPPELTRSAFTVLLLLSTFALNLSKIGVDFAPPKASAAAKNGSLANCPSAVRYFWVLKKPIITSNICNFTNPLPT